ncbi:MAG TPA: lipopolysaccharide assembly protein LapA domain-containing protein [Thermodesulfobacteriota bacterium]|nr:lipopolysaccharide assembly protein LapA domain-containing protein [Thermodesulfobacteriota bacterium]
MQVFVWLAFLFAVLIAVFAVQNSTAAPVNISFLVWQFQTSIIYTILASFGAGILFVLLLWARSALRCSRQIRTLRRENASLKDARPQESIAEPGAPPPP